MQRQARVPHAAHEQLHLVIGEPDRTGCLFEILRRVVQGFVQGSVSEAIRKSKVYGTECAHLLIKKTLNVSVNSRDQDPPMAVDEACHQLNEVGHGFEYHPSKRS